MIRQIIFTFLFYYFFFSYRLFKAFSLWLEEPRLQEINLHLPSLPLQYEPSLLALILHGDTVNDFYFF